MKRAPCFLPAGLALAALLLRPLAAAAPQTRSDEGFLVLTLLKAQIQINRISGEIETGKQELETNHRIIDEAERKLSIALETHNRQATIVPGNDLRRARAARSDLEKAQSQRKKALSRAEGASAVLKERLASDSRREPAPRAVALVSSESGSATVLQSDGGEATLKGGQAGLLGPGDEVRSNGKSRVDVQAFDGRAIIQLDGGSRLKIEEDEPEAQTLRLVRGRLSATVEKPEVLERMIQETAQGPDDDLAPLLKRYRDLAGREGRAKSLRIALPAAVCSVMGARFSIEIKDEGGTTEILAVEGTVDIGDLKGERRVLVEEGYKVTVTKNGIIGPMKVR